MAASLKFNPAEFQDMANELRRLKRFSAAEMLTYMGKMLVGYLIKATPPFTRHPFSEAGLAAKKIGEQSIKRDWGKAFLPMTQTVLQRIGKAYSPRKASYFLRYAKEGALGKAQKMMRALGIPESIGLIRFPSASIVSQAIGFNRRPHPIKRRYLVIDGKKTAQLLKEAVSHIGTAKAGWLRSAEVLGVKKIPAWVLKQRGRFSGAILDQRHQELIPSLTMINSTKGAAAIDDDVVAVAMKELQRSGLQKQLEHIGRKRAARFNAGQRQLPA